ncbi:AAA ATPase-like protein [Kribbella orskensis]|uniref:AAA ATPase-like protein n=1 Tax=Kribbella orskensis TaxID=2512216 RepID=A0ABY2BMQ5_9ACTN|nr:AAA ATPase-like protein [Kribbella sp. VKM Ac-2500]TCO25662.1 AAA ATPase-like protein [Kribbella orskensis]
MLILRGEPGIGKTALLGYAASQAAGFRVVRAAGVESEMELPFAGVHQVCAPILGRIDSIPSPQRDALRIAFGLQEGPAPDRFMVGLAVLTLLAEEADEQPLLCMADDAQWLDQSSLQVLSFVARRLVAERIAMLFGSRAPEEAHELAGLPDLTLRGLADRDARALLASAVHGPLDPQVRDRIIAETGGNPLALLQLPRDVGPAELAGGFWLPGAGQLTTRIENSFVQQFRRLPPETQTVLLLAAAEPTGDAALLSQAGALMGVDPEASAPAESAGLVECGAVIRFGHPLVRSAVYQAASAVDRRAAHQALAEATDPASDPDRRAWHRAHATVGPDETVAAELERSAGRAQARGGLAAAAAFLERAAALTPDSWQRTDRALAAAEAKTRSGAFDGALKLLALAEARPLDELRRARIDLLSAQLAFVSNRGSEASPLLVAAARRLEPIDVDLARATYLDALNAAIFAGSRARPGGSTREVARAARRALAASLPLSARDLLLDGLATNFSEGYSAGLPRIRRALTAFERDNSTEAEHRWLWLAGIAANHAWDERRWDMFSGRHVRFTRDSGALSELPFALNQRAYVVLFAGDLMAASALVEEAQAATEAMGGSRTQYAALALAALRGDEAETAALARAAKEDFVLRGESIGNFIAKWATALLNNGLGNYHVALAAAADAYGSPPDVTKVAWGLVEGIEAAARSGSPDLGTDALRRLTETTSVAGGDWALGIEARSRALLSEGESADELYREAITRLTGTRMRVELARAYLVHGEWLRRANRRVEAREQLRVAYEMLTEMGMNGFAARARRELVSTGEVVRRRAVDDFAQLTAQETQIARLARDGMTNQEISTHLFISPRTVEWHLSNVFTKLGITSRKDLRPIRP